MKTVRTEGKRIHIRRALHYLLVVTLTLALVVPASLVWTAQPVAAASETIENTTGATDVSDVNGFGQSFTPTNNISVTGAQFYMASGSGSGSSRNVQIQIRTALNSGSLGTSQILSVNTTLGWKTFSFSTPIQLTAGTTYYMVVSSTSGDLDYRYNTDSNSYVVGQRLTGSGTSYSTAAGDLMFRVTNEIIVRFDLSVTSDGCGSITVGSLGTVTSGNTQVFSVANGTTVNLTAQVTGCCVFGNWTGDVTSPPNTDNPITVTVNANKSVVGHFGACERPELQGDKTAEAVGCREYRVTLNITGAASEQKPVDVMIVFDRSGSMEGAPLSSAKTAASTFISQLTEDDRVGLVSYSDNADNAAYNEALTFDHGAVNSTINSLPAGGYTNIGDAIYNANQELITNGREEAVKVLIVFSDGVANRRHEGSSTGCGTYPCTSTVCTQDAINQAQVAKDAGITVFSVLLTNITQADSGCTIASVTQLGRNTMQAIASDPDSDHYYETPTPEDLEEIFLEIAGAIKAVFYNVVLADAISEYFVVGNITSIVVSTGNATYNPGTKTITWNVGLLGNTTETLTYTVIAEDGVSGMHEVNESVEVTYEYEDGTPGEFDDFPVPQVDVPGELVADASSNSPVCEGGTIELYGDATGGTGGYTWNWTGPNGFSSSLQSPTIAGATNAMEGNYTLFVINGHCCVGNDTVELDVVDCTPPTVDINKVVNPVTRPEPGGTFTYNITITNNCSENVTITALSDTNAAGAAALAPYIGNNMTPGQVITVTYAVNYTEAGTYNNTANVTVEDDAGNPASDSDGAQAEVTDVMPDVELNKTATPGSLPEPGGVFTFTLNITNNSDETVTITSLNDTNALSAGCLALISQTIPAHGSVSCTYNVTHTEAGNYTNTASVTVQDNEGNSDSDSDDETVRVTDVMPDVELNKTATPGSLPEPGGVFTFTLNITNNSVEQVQITSLTDTNTLSPGCLALNGTYLNPGQSVTCTYNATHTDPGSYNNTASVTVEDNEGNPDSDTDDETVTVTDVTSSPLVIVKSGVPTELPEPGGEFYYQAVITNPAANVDNITITALTDSVYGGALSCESALPVTLAPGESMTCTFNVTHTGNAGDSWTNHVNATAIDDDGHNASAQSNDVTVSLTEGPVTPAGGGSGCCCPPDYLTVDWEGYNTSKPLWTNGCLAVDLLGPSPDGSDSLFLEVGTHAPVVDGDTYYLIVVRELEEIPPVPENYEAIVVLNVTPADAEFNKDISLTVGLNQTQLPQNVLNLTMAYYNDVNGLWETLEYEAGGPNGVAELTLSAPINHFSIYGVLAKLGPTTPTQPAHFVPSGLSITPSVEKISAFLTKSGETVTISANIANDGGKEGTYNVVLKLNGQTVDTKTVTLAAGQSKQVSFTKSGLDYGQYDVEVAGLTGEFTASRTIAWWLIILIIVAIGLIIWGVVWGRRRRRKAQQEA